MDEKLIVIAIESYAKAVVLQSYLEANGIECFLRNENILQGAVSEGVKVQIRESDAEKALRLLSEQKFSEEAKKREKPLRKILVPVDFSEPSQNAARFAVMLAEKYNAEIKLLHVFNSPVVDMIPFADVSGIQIDFDINFNMLYKAAKEKLIKFHADLVEFARQMGFNSVSIGYTLQEGYAAYGIVEVSKRYKPGIIVMGTKGEGFKSTELVGSVASEVSEETKVPLLAIPEKAVLKGVDEVKNVLYATNLDESDFGSIRKLIRILSPFNFNLHCVNMTNRPDNVEIKALMSSLKNYLYQVNPELSVEYSIVECKDMVKSFIDYIYDKKINLVALTSVKRSLIYKLFNPSLSKKMLYQSNVPVLLFQA
jgi:nucleotide-binding universal stress UspA family protein